MPPVTLNSKRLATKTRSLLLTVSFLLLTVILSGCSAIGFSRPAALQVTSRPEASIFLDGKHIGKTPFYSDQLIKGEYLLKVTVSEASYVDRITLRESTLTVVNRDLASNFLAQSGENLSLVPNKKGLFIISTPGDSDITIDGKYAGKSPSLIKDLQDGNHKVQISKKGFLEREFVISTSSKYQLMADVTLASQIAKSGITKKEPNQLDSKRALILSTPQGFLRVRTEPSLSAEEIGQAKVGEDFEIIQETKDWFQISFDGKLGWISTAYSQIVE